MWRKNVSQAAKRNQPETDRMFVERRVGLLDKRVEDLCYNTRLKISRNEMYV